MLELMLGVVRGGIPSLPVLYYVGTVRWFSLNGLYQPSFRPLPPHACSLITEPFRHPAAHPRTFPCCPSLAVIRYNNGR